MAQPRLFAAVLFMCACGGGGRAAPVSTPISTPEASDSAGAEQGELTMSAEPEATYTEVLCAIASDIEAAKDRYPQLADFSAAQHCDAEKLEVGYGFRTHRSQGRGGWAGSVPNPDDDGVWFHLDFHDPNSTAQIHTQPVVMARHFRDKAVMLLLLDGANTQSLGAVIGEAMTAHGVKDGPVP